MLDPFAHAARVTGSTQVALVDTWASSGIAVALSEVTGPHVYQFGAMPVPTVAVTLYGVRRHVLMVDGRVRRDGRVLPGRFRIGQPGHDVVVDAVPGQAPGKLLLMYLGPALLVQVAADTGRTARSCVARPRAKRGFAGGPASQVRPLSAEGQGRGARTNPGLHIFPAATFAGISVCVLSARTTGCAICGMQRCSAAASWCRCVMPIEMTLRPARSRYPAPASP